MKFQLVKNSPAFYEFMRLLRNDPGVQLGFIEQVNVSPDQQQKYMARYASNYYICLVDGEPAGYIGQIEGDIRIATHPDYQSQGVGNFMVQEFMRVHPGCFAKVKAENAASLQLFKKNGFKERFVILYPEQV